VADSVTVADLTGQRLAFRIVNQLAESATGNASVFDLTGHVLNPPVCADTEMIHHCLEDTMSPDVYFRFQPVGVEFSCDLDETQQVKLDAMSARRMLILTFMSFFLGSLQS
jgi:hypothetical protein